MARRSNQPAPDRVNGALQYFAVVSPGLEAAAALELERRFGERAKEAAIRTTLGGVEFSGPLELCYRANLWSRIATRILIRLGEFEAHDFATLRRRAALLPWEQVCQVTSPLTWVVSTQRSRLYHTGAIAEQLQGAVCQRLGVSGLPSMQAGDAKPASDRGAAGKVRPMLVRPMPMHVPAAPTLGPSAVRVVVRAVNHRFTLSIDSSGDLLHRRGWRTEGALAPIRETLAAGVLALCQWDGTGAFCDPMCGAGTFAIEACLMAIDSAPGGDRHFACEEFPGCDGRLWRALRAQAQQHTDEVRRKRAQAMPAVYAFDVDRDAVGAARRNAERAGVADLLTIEQQPLNRLRPHAASGLLVCNPPYGRRVSSQATALPRFYDELATTLRGDFAEWRVGVVVADRRLAGRLTRPGRRRSPTSGASRSADTPAAWKVHPLRHGGLRVSLLFRGKSGSGDGPIE